MKPQRNYSTPLSQLGMAPLAPSLQARLTRVGGAGVVGASGGLLIRARRLTAAGRRAGCRRTILISSNRSASSAANSNNFPAPSSNHCQPTSEEPCPAVPTSPEALLSKLEWKEAFPSHSRAPPPLVRPRPLRPMAAFHSSTYSTASSDFVSTPRAASPSSVVSARSSHTSISSNKRMSLSSRRSRSQFNPMSSVDITAIEEQMKMASLDGLRGYAQDHYGEVQQYVKTEYVPKSAATGYQILREPLWNKGGWNPNLIAPACPLELGASLDKRLLTRPDSGKQAPHSLPKNEYPRTCQASCPTPWRRPRRRLRGA